MGGHLLSALAVAAVLGVAAAAAVDSIRSEAPRYATPPLPPRACREGQLDLELDARSDPPVVVLRHAGGPRCTVPAYDVVVQVVPTAGEPQDLVLPIDVSGLSAPRVQSERTFRYHPRCDEGGPFHAVARVGPYSAEADIPVMPCQRTPKEVAAFHEACVRSWNGRANRMNRELVGGDFGMVLLFRSSDGARVERCGVHFVSSVTARELVAYSGGDGWSIGRGRPARVYDDRSAEIGTDGTLSLTGE